MVKIIGERIRQIRRSKNLSQKNVADMLYMDVRTYSKIERGERKSVDIVLILNIAQKLAVPIEAILSDVKDAKDAEQATPTNGYSLKDMAIQNSKILRHLLEEIKILKNKLLENDLH